MTFQQAVVIFFILLLIICLTVIGVTLKKGAANVNGTRTPPACPDYWRPDASGNCVNIRDLGTCPPPLGQTHLTMDFNQSPYVGSDGDCQKYTWATKCGVAWENITYGISGTPCDSSSSTTS